QSWIKINQSLINYIFFFQAEDGIRDLYVTGVQTCALPICANASFEVSTSNHSPLSAFPVRADLLFQLPSALRLQPARTFYPFLPQDPSGGGVCQASCFFVFPAFPRLVALRWDERLTGYH